MARNDRVPIRPWLLPLRPDDPYSEPWRKLPLVTIAVIALCTGVWLLQVVHGVPVMGARAPALIAWGGFVPLYVLTGQAWRLVTALFVHADAVHLGLNMLVFGATANQVERALGAWRTLAIFLVGGILANAGSTWWIELNATPQHFGRLLTVMVGSAGGVMALISAALVPSLLGSLGVQPWADLHGRRIDTAVLWPIAINVGVCFVIPHWDPASNIAGSLAGLAIGAILLVAPAHQAAAATALRFAAIGLLLAACVHGVSNSGDRDFLARLRLGYDDWRITHP